MPKKITQILIEGYTSIRSATVAIGDVTVLVGANGAGKSNFIAALELLGRIADQGLAFEVGLRGGASALLNAAGSGARHIRLRIEADSDLAGRTDTYEATLIPAANEELVFARETASHFEAPGSPRLIQQDFGGGTVNQSSEKQRKADSLLWISCVVAVFSTSRTPAELRR